MAKTFPRRDLGPAEYWGRTVENRLQNAEKVWGIQGQSLAGQSRATSSTFQSIGNQIERLQVVQSEIPYIDTASTYEQGFAVPSGWTTIASLPLLTGGKRAFNIIAYGNLNINDTGGAAGPGLFIWPFSPSLITSEYGPRDGRFHEGTDFAGGAASAGNNIPATSGGTVYIQGYHSDWGNRIMIYHGVYSGFEIYTHYCHMQSPSPLSVGASVTQGQTVGQVGNTGLSFGAHLHYETHMVPPGGSLIWDPDNPGYGSDRTAVDVRDFMDIYGDPTTSYDLGMRCRIQINGVNSRVFHPFRNTFVPPDLPNSFYPVYGRTSGTAASTVTVSLQAFSTVGISAQSSNRAVLTAEGIFS